MEEIIQVIQERQQMLSKEVERIHAKLMKTPDGHLRVSLNHGHVQYYHITKKGDTTGRYLKKRKEMQMVKALAQKDYYNKLLPILLEQNKKIQSIVRELENMKKPRIYHQLSDTKKLLVTPSILDADVYKEWWEEIQFRGKDFSEDAPEIYTEKGERVRSKSEKMIADKLYMLGIPYRYEYPMEMKGYGIVYPDFTILDTKNNREYILEHFGMMDNPDYANAAIRKINMYERQGYFIGDNLLVTFESSYVTINMKNLENMILKKIR